MHVRRALALTLAVPLLMAGCSDDPEPTPKMPDPTTSSSTPEPTETETAEPESAEDFVRRWVEAGDAMQQTGKVGEFRAMSKGCQACADLIENVSTIYGEGGRIEFDGTSISNLRMSAKQPPTFLLDLDTPVTRIIAPSGEVEDELPAGVGKYIVTLAEAESSWRVAHYARR